MLFWHRDLICAHNFTLISWWKVRPWHAEHSFSKMCKTCDWKVNFWFASCTLQQYVRIFFLKVRVISSRIFEARDYQAPPVFERRKSGKKICCKKLSRFRLFYLLTARYNCKVSFLECENTCSILQLPFGNYTCQNTWLRVCILYGSLPSEHTNIQWWQVTASLAFPRLNSLLGWVALHSEVQTRAADGRRLPYDGCLTWYR